jgi:GntR family transcriptional regulator
MAVSQKSLDRRRGPLYQQFAGALREQITAGNLAVGAALPTEAELAARYAISLITVRHGLRQLEHEGLIRKQSAKPAIVTASRPLVRPGIDFHSLAAIVAATRDRRLDVRSYGEEPATDAAAAALERPRGERLYCLRALLYFDEAPVSDITIHFPHAVGVRLARGDFDDTVVFRTVQRKLGIRLSGARITLKADVADAETARAMQYPEGGALLVAEMLYRAEDGTAVEYSVARNRADMFSVTYDAPNDIG